MLSMPEHQKIQQLRKLDSTYHKQATLAIQTHLLNATSVIQRAKINPKSLSHTDVMQLQHTIGNRAVGRLLSGIGTPSKAQQTTIQWQKISEQEEPLQRKFERKSKQELCLYCVPTLQREKDNRTGMLDNLKSGLEHLSGMDLSDVRVHHNSSKPEKVGALAYTQGKDIHVGPGQEKYLPHEGWHVVQQAQGRVKPTIQMRGLAVNNDVRLEAEADAMGEKAIQMRCDDYLRGIGSEHTSGKRPSTRSKHQEGQASKQRDVLHSVWEQKYGRKKGKDKLSFDMWRKRDCP